MNSEIPENYKLLLEKSREDYQKAEDILRGQN